MTMAYDAGAWAKAKAANDVWGLAVQRVSRAAFESEVWRKGKGIAERG